MKAFISINKSVFKHSLFCIALGISVFSQQAHSTLTKSEIERLLVCYKDLMKSTTTGKEKYKIAMNGLSDDKLFKLFIDSKRLESPSSDEQKVPPHLMFDVKEPGYYQSMTNAF